MVLLSAASTLNAQIVWRIDEQFSLSAHRERPLAGGGTWVEDGEYRVQLLINLSVRPGWSLTEGLLLAFCFLSEKWRDAIFSITTHSNCNEC